MSANWLGKGLKRRECISLSQSPLNSLRLGWEAIGEWGLVRVRIFFFYEIILLKNSKTPGQLELGFVVDGKGGVVLKGTVERDICFG
jgi:hypothetical protein